MMWCCFERFRAIPFVPLASLCACYERGNVFRIMVSKKSSFWQEHARKKTLPYVWAAECDRADMLKKSQTSQTHS